MTVIEGLNYAPWTEGEVESLNAFQRSNVFHPFTCGNDRCRDELVATKDGWRCNNDDYVQNWAHPWMADWSWKRNVEKYPAWLK